MIDKENLKIGLEEVSDFFFEMYRKETNEYKATKAKEYCDIAEDVLALLEEQKAKSPVVREKNGYWDYVCPTCGSRDEELFREWNYCPFCGQAVKWE